MMYDIEHTCKKSINRGCEQLKIGYSDLLYPSTFTSPEIPFYRINLSKMFNPKEYVPIDFEGVEMYAPGRLPAVNIGDHLQDGRYEILNKLGHGFHSNVWLARDNRLVELYLTQVVTLRIQH